VVTDYLTKAGLQADLDALGFNLVGYGCTTCIGNSDRWRTTSPPIESGNLVTRRVSGNRNFEGRVNPHTKANYLASPPLVVAYALAGSVCIDLATQPLGNGKDGKPAFEDIWPTNQEIQDAIRASLTPRCSARAMPMCSPAQEVAGDQDTENKTSVGRMIRLRQIAAAVRSLAASAATGDGCEGRQAARAARRLDYHRSHFNRRRHQEEQPGRQIPDRAWCDRRSLIPTVRAAVTMK